MIRKKTIKEDYPINEQALKIIEHFKFKKLTKFKNRTQHLTFLIVEEIGRIFDINMIILIYVWIKI